MITWATTWKKPTRERVMIVLMDSMGRAPACLWVIIAEVSAKHTRARCDLVSQVHKWQQATKQKTEKLIWLKVALFAGVILSVVMLLKKLAYRWRYVVKLDNKWEDVKRFCFFVILFVILKSLDRASLHAEPWSSEGQSVAVIWWGSSMCASCDTQDPTAFTDSRESPQA